MRIRHSDHNSSLHASSCGRGIGRFPRPEQRGRIYIVSMKADVKKRLLRVGKQKRILFLFRFLAYRYLIDEVKSEWSITIAPPLLD